MIKQKKKIHDVNDRSFEIIQFKVNKEKIMKKSEESLHESRGIIKRNNISTAGVPKGEETEKGAESLFKEITAEIFAIWEEIWTSKFISKIYKK